MHRVVAALLFSSLSLAFSPVAASWRVPNNGLDPWAEQLEDAGAEAHAKMAAWLNRFFKSTPAEDLSPPPPLMSVTRPRTITLPERDVPIYKESDLDGHAWKVWNKTQSCSMALQHQEKPERRRHLLISPVGSSFDASNWMTHPDYATYDIVALYYGRDESFSCPLCKYVIRGGGAKWYLLNKFIRENSTLWERLAGQYDSVMVADDDVLFDTCILNRAFEVFSAYNLLMGQPSLCRTPYPSTYWQYLYSDPENVLRYVSFVEIMAPMFRMDFFQNVIAPSLWNAFAGWGLDFTWPFLLRYPRRHIGVIDDVCMTHSAPSGRRVGEGNLYSVPVPYNEREEETRRVGEYGYYASRVEAMGFVYRNMQTLGIVPKIYLNEAMLPIQPSSRSLTDPRSRGEFIEDQFVKSQESRTTKDALDEKTKFPSGALIVVLLAVGFVTIAMRFQNVQAVRHSRRNRNGLAHQRPLNGKLHGTTSSVSA